MHSYKYVTTYFYFCICITFQSIEIPEKLRPRDHMAKILRLNEENDEVENLLSKTIENTLKELKKLYDAAIKPLEILYKYRELSNRHYGGKKNPVFFFMTVHILTLKRSDYYS